MSPLNRGPLMGPRIPPTMRPPMPRYGRAPPPPPGMVRGMPPPPMNPMFGPRGRPIPPPPPRPGPMMARPGGLPVPPMFGPRNRLMPPMPPLMPPMGLRGPMGPRGPLMRPGPRGILPPHALPHMRPRFPPNHVNGKGKANTAKKANKLEELELKKPWMTDEIRSEIQKKNKLYAKAKKNKDAKEWEEFKDLRNKVTRMIRDAKNEFLQKNPQQVPLYENDEEIPEVTDEDIAEFFAMDSEEEESMNLYCEACDRDFDSEEKLEKHTQEHQTCMIDGCTFTAHSKIVKNHISMQHSTGLYDRMKNVMSTEDIAKWRAERKRRYPTAATIKLQEDEQIEKEKRGEVIKNEVERQKIQNLPKREQRKTRKRKRNKPTQLVISADPIKCEVYRGLLPFAGTAMLGTNEKMAEFSIENTEGVESVDLEVKECKIALSDDEESIPKIEQVVIQSDNTKLPKPDVSIPQLLSLVADYKSESDDNEPPEEVPFKKLKASEELIPEKPESQIQSMKITNIIETQSDSNLLESASTSKHNKKSIVKNEKMKEKDEKSDKCISKKRNNFQYSNGRLKLLNRLLARSIQHERNAIYQCITFIANNNFFD